MFEWYYHYYVNCTGLLSGQVWRLESGMELYIKTVESDVLKLYLCKYEILIHHKSQDIGLSNILNTTRNQNHRNFKVF